MDNVEDKWVREFDVSNPQKTHAGYTVYRITSKLYPKGSPEAASEVIVFKRYSEIRKLYKDLKQLYESKDGWAKKFPHFSKANFFSRFDEAVIQERQKQALRLLTFAGSSFLLFTSQTFIRFFEDGVQPRGSSMASNDSDQQFPPEEAQEAEMEPWTPQPYFATSSSDEDTGQEVPEDGTLLDENVAPVANKAWLARAMSLCSEGDDIEILASEAGCDGVGSRGTGDDSEATAVGNREKSPRGSHPSQASLDMLPTLLESSGEEQEDVFVDVLVEVPSIKPDSRTNLEDSNTQGVFTGESSTDKFGTLGHPPQTTDTTCGDENASATSLRSDNMEQVPQAEDLSSNTPNDTSSADENNGEPGIIEREQVDRRVSNIGVSWIDPRKKDYLYEAAQVIQEALYCEANEFYEKAFNKYKMCVAILLKGVQHDNNAKRREAVRRKTAQYLVKAEFLFNTYLKEDQENTKNDWSIKSCNTSEDLHLQGVVERRFYQLTLRSLKVIGVIKKVMLIQCEDLEEVFVVKVLHKTNAVHRSAKQVESKHNNKGHAKKYVKSSRMVKLYRHFDSNNSIFLLLQHASGGELWSHVGNVRGHDVTHDVSSSDWPNVTNTEHEEAEHLRIPNTQYGNTDRDNSPKGGGISNTFANSDKMYPNAIETGGLRKTVKNDSMKCTNDNLFSHNVDLISQEDQGVGEDNNPNQNIVSQGALGHVTKSDHVIRERYVQRWIAELLLAVASVHSCGIVLKDLKPTNVLLDDDGHVTLTYFGIWEEVDHSVDLEAVERLYCAPEISCGEKITFAADWWSLGVLSYELLTGKSLSSSHPWGIHPHSTITFPTENISAEARSLLTGLICHNPNERLGSGVNGVEEIKSHSFFKGVDWDELSDQ